MNLALTIDYELWGDGSGCLFDEVIRPTEDFLTLCKKNNVKTTIFFEAIEYWKLRDEWNRGNTMGYMDNPIEAIEKQLIKAYQDGHDIQLHLHPQWVDARFENNKWIVDTRFWRLSDVPAHADENISMGLYEIIKKGKETLENLLQPVDPEYKCHIFRAGGYNIVPSDKIIPILNDLDFQLDSSVYPGGYENGTLSRYDYRSIKNNIPYWKVSEHSVLEKGNSNILELTIFTKPGLKLFKHSLQRILFELKNRNKTSGRVKNQTSKPGKIQKIKSLFETEFHIFDFCLLSKRQLKSFFYYAQKTVKKSEYPVHPIVLIGHSKNMYFPDNYKYFIDYCLKKNTTFLTLSQINDLIRKNKK